MSVYLDTHIVLWLYSGEIRRLSKRAAQAINTNALSVGPMVVLELKYLNEIGRITAAPHAILAELKRQIGVSLRSRPMNDVVDLALGLDWTRDVFDRMIVAQAALEDLPLISSDRTIRKHYSKTVW